MAIQSMLGTNWLVKGFSEAAYGAFEGIMQILYQLWATGAAIITIMEDIFKKLAGIEPVYYKGEKEGDIFTLLFNQGPVQAIFTNLVAVAFVLLIFFAIVKIIQENYKQKEGGNPYQVVFKMIKGMCLFIFIPAAVVVGVAVSGVVFGWLNSATGGGRGVTMSGQIFRSMAYNANRVKRGVSSEDVDFWEQKNEKLASLQNVAAGLGGSRGSYSEVWAADISSLREEESKSGATQTGVMTAAGAASPVAISRANLMQSRRRVYMPYLDTERDGIVWYDVRMFWQHASEPYQLLHRRIVDVITTVTIPKGSYRFDIKEVTQNVPKRIYLEQGTVADKYPWLGLAHEAIDKAAYEDEAKKALDAEKNSKIAEVQRDFKEELGNYMYLEDVNGAWEETPPYGNPYQNYDTFPPNPPLGTPAGLTAEWGWTWNGTLWYQTPYPIKAGMIKGNNNTEAEANLEKINSALNSFNTGVEIAEDDKYDLAKINAQIKKAIDKIYDDMADKFDTEKNGVDDGIKNMRDKESSGELDASSGVSYSAVPKPLGKTGLYAGLDIEAEAREAVKKDLTEEINNKSSTLQKLSVATNVIMGMYDLVKNKQFSVNYSKEPYKFIEVEVDVTFTLGFFGSSKTFRIQSKIPIYYEFPSEFTFRFPVIMGPQATALKADINQRIDESVGFINSIPQFEQIIQDAEKRKNTPVSTGPTSSTMAAVGSGDVFRPSNVYPSGQVYNMTSTEIDRAFMMRKEASPILVVLRDPEKANVSYVDSTNWYNWGYGNVNNSTMSYQNNGVVAKFYDMGSMDYLIGFAGIFVVGGVFINFTFGLIQRLLEMLVLFALSPLTIAFFPFDDGTAFKGQFMKPFYQKVISVYAVVISMNVFFMLYPVFGNITLFPDNESYDWTNFWVGMMISLSLITMLPKVKTLVASALGSSADLEQKGLGKALKEGWDTARGKKAWDATAGFRKSVAKGIGTVGGAYSALNESSRNKTGKTLGGRFGETRFGKAMKKVKEKTGFGRDDAGKATGKATKLWDKFKNTTLGDSLFGVDGWWEKQAQNKDSIFGAISEFQRRNRDDVLQDTVHKRRQEKMNREKSVAAAVAERATMAIEVGRDAEKIHNNREELIARTMAARGLTSRADAIAYIDSQDNKARKVDNAGGFEYLLDSHLAAAGISATDPNYAKALELAGKGDAKGLEALISDPKQAAKLANMGVMAKAGDATAIFQSELKQIEEKAKANAISGGKSEEEAIKKAVDARKAAIDALEHGDIGGFEAFAKNGGVDTTKPAFAGKCDSVSALNLTANHGVMAEIKLNEDIIRVTTDNDRIHAGVIENLVKHGIGKDEADILASKIGEQYVEINAGTATRKAAQDAMKAAHDAGSSTYVYNGETLKIGTKDELTKALNKIEEDAWKSFEATYSHLNAFSVRDVDLKGKYEQILETVASAQSRELVANLNMAFEAVPGDLQRCITNDPMYIDAMTEDGGALKMSEAIHRCIKSGGVDTAGLEPEFAEKIKNASQKQLENLRDWANTLKATYGTSTEAKRGNTISAARAVTFETNKYVAVQENMEKTKQTINSLDSQADRYMERGNELLVAIKGRLADSAFSTIPQDLISKMAKGADLKDLKTALQGARGTNPETDRLINEQLSAIENMESAFANEETSRSQMRNHQKLYDELSKRIVLDKLRKYQSGGGYT